MKIKLSDTIYHYSKEERVLEKAEDYQSYEFINSSTVVP